MVYYTHHFLTSLQEKVLSMLLGECYTHLFCVKTRRHFILPTSSSHFGIHITLVSAFCPTSHTRTSRWQRQISLERKQSTHCGQSTHCQRKLYCSLKSRLWQSNMFKKILIDTKSMGMIFWYIILRHSSYLSFLCDKRSNHFSCSFF